MNTHRYPGVECSVSCSAHSRCFSSQWWNRSKLNYPFIPVHTNICVLRKKNLCYFLLSYQAWHDILYVQLIHLRINFSVHKYLNIVQNENSFGKFIFKIRVATWRCGSVAEPWFGGQGELKVWRAGCGLIISSHSKACKGELIPQGLTGSEALLVGWAERPLINGMVYTGSGGHHVPTDMISTIILGGH